MLVEKQELEDVLIPALEDIMNNKRATNRIKKRFEEYDVQGGIVTQILVEPSRIKTVDMRLVILLTNLIYEETKNPDINPKSLFTPAELKEAQTYSGELYSNSEPIFPLSLGETTMIGNSAYITKMSAKKINELLSGGALTYNFLTQREATYLKAKGQQTPIRVATLNNTSVKEIAGHLLDGTKIPDMLTFNARPRSADCGDELTFDSKKRVLTINEGTILDILDGYHRSKGIQLALSINPDIDFDFPVMIVNYTIAQARRYLGQMAKANPISKARAAELSQSSLSTTVVQQLREESMLKGRISQTERIITINKEIVSVSVLMESIEEEFDLKNKRDALDVGEYLVKVFDYLLSYFEEEFTTKYEETRKVSFINYNQMFAGYITLAARLYKQQRNAKDIVEIVRGIDFSKENSLWESIGLMRDGKVDYSKAKKRIVRYFSELEI